jgi:ABC-type multidrug transport system ATPase subunit
MKGRIQIQAQDLHVRYENTVALDIPSLKIKGTVIAVVGHNGSGKSTFIKSLLELLTPSSGYLQAFISSDNISEIPSRLVPENDMAFAPEDGSVFEDITVEQYVQLWCNIKHRDPNYYKKQGSSYIEKLNVSSLFPRLGRELSKGQRRRVQTLVTLLIQPKLLLLDEPFDVLDIVQTNLLNEVLSEELKGKGLIISSHRMDVIERLADMVLVLNKGEIVAHGSLSVVSEELCEQSIVISQDSKEIDVSQISTALRGQFASCVINKIGENLVISGKGICLTELNQFFKNENLNGIQIKTTPPSLMDAMNYYLKNCD